MYFAFYLKSYFFLLPKSSLSLVARACVFPQACHNPQFLTVLHFSPLRPFFCQLRKTFHFMFFFFFWPLFPLRPSLFYTHIYYMWPCFTFPHYYFPRVSLIQCITFYKKYVHVAYFSPSGTLPHLSYLWLVIASLSFKLFSLQSYITFLCCYHYQTS